MKHLIAADLHLRPEAWARLPRVRGDAYASLSHIVELAISNPVATVWLLGDVFDSATPDALSVQKLHEAAEQLWAHGIKLVVLQGNHDAVAIVDVDGSNTAWARSIRAEWAHERVFQLAPGVYAWGMDYTPPTKIPEALQRIPSHVSVLFAHQAWAELQKVGHTDINVAMLPPQIRYVFTGDYHVTERVAAMGPAGPVELFSPGSTAMQAMNECPQKYALVLDTAGGVIATPVPLRTRPFLKLVFRTPAEFDAYLAGPPPVFAGLLPAEITKPLVHVQAARTVPKYRERLQQFFGDTVHLDTLPVADVPLDIQVALDAVPTGFSTLVDAVRELGHRGGVPADTVADCIRILNATDRQAELAAIRREFVEKLHARRTG